MTVKRVGKDLVIQITAYGETKIEYQFEET